MMKTLRKASFDEANTSIENMTLYNVDLGGGVLVQKQVSHPGWKWSKNVRPVVGTDSCQKHHVGICVSGHLKLTNVDGSEIDVHAGDAYVFEPGHDAWVVGDEDFVAYEFDSQTAATYAKS